MRFLTKTILCFILGSVVISSCSKNDVYDPNYLKEQYDEAFKANVLGGADIDSQQTWNASVMSSLNVTIQLDVNETYILRLFTENPLYDNTATLLAQSTGKTGGTVTMQFAKPLASKLLYIEAINSKNRFTVQAVNMEGTASSISLGASVVSRSNVRGISTDPATYQKNESVFLNQSLLTKNYYDVTNIPQGKLGEMDVVNYNVNPNVYYYGDGKHYEIPAGKTVIANLGYSKEKDADCVILVRGTWTVPSDIQFSNSQLIIVDNGGKIIFNGNAAFNSGARFVNKGTIEMTSGTLSIENWSTAEADCYNSGTMTLNNGGLSVAGSHSQLYNCGTISMKYLDARGTCTFTNFGTLTAESTTKDNYETSGQTTAASNFYLVNGCYAKINAAGIFQFILCNNSRLDCPTGIFTGGGKADNFVVVGDHAVIKAGNWIDNGGKFYGPVENDNAAVFKFTGSIQEKNCASFSTGGYLFFDGNLSNSNDVNNDDGHYQLTIIRTGQWYGSVSNSNYIQNTSSESLAKITIPEGDCTGDGYNPKNNPVNPPVTNPARYYYAYEDMGSIGDYDFNDVVLSVEYPIINGNQKDAVIKLCAAGGTLPVSVKYGSETICEEVHSAFGVGVSTMVNTGNTVKDVVTLKTLPNVGDNFNASNLDLSIIVSGNKTSTEVRANTQSGGVPQMIRVPSPWKWPKEKVNISVAYSEDGFSFGAWGANYTTNIEWYKHPFTSRVIE